jgi:hypothetical protein
VAVAAESVAGTVEAAVAVVMTGEMLIVTVVVRVTGTVVGTVAVGAVMTEVTVTMTAIVIVSGTVAEEAAVVFGMIEVTAIVTVAVTAASVTVWEIDWCGRWCLRAA